MIARFQKDKLVVQIFEDRTSLGEAAATEAGNKIVELLRQKDCINIIFAAAPSQQEFLAALLSNEAINWEKINAFHMDEYLGLEASATQGFGNFLRSKIFSHKPFRSVNYINGNTTDIKTECTRYADLLQKYPPDIVCMGIGENTHIAFNDPGVADFNDPLMVKGVPLDAACRQQQVNDKCFSTLADVPTHALTLTIPALLHAPFIYCMVPGPTKAKAIWQTLHAPISAEYPSTILRNQHAAMLFVDKESYSICENDKL